MLKPRPLALVAAVLALILSGCAQKSPVEKMESMRAKHSAELNAIIVEPNVPAAPAEDAAEDAAGEPVDEQDASASETESTEMLEAETLTPTTSDVVLDIVVRTEADEKLPGVTLDITMAGAGGEEKERWTLWVDTSALPRGPGTQVEHRLESVQYEEGDGFHVEIRHPIPEEERSTYREYADAG